VEELLAERGVAVDRVTIYRRVQAFTSALPTGADEAGPRIDHPISLARGRAPNNATDPRAATPRLIDWPIP
jgi:hypothetical protein